MTKHTTPATAVIDYVYDKLNRLTDKKFPATPALDSKYDYDVGSRLTVADITAANGTKLSFTYDNLNRIKILTATWPSVTGPGSLTYDYDKVGNRTKLTYPSGKVVDYTYDVHDRMDLVKVNTATLTDYDYDPLDRRQSKIFRATSPETQATYSFDLANQLQKLTNLKSGQASPLSEFEYPNYDNVGNRLTQKILRNQQTNQTNYGYNAIYELTSTSGAQTHAFMYDNVANRKLVDGVTYQSNNINQYTSVGAQAYSYDANGNLTNDGTNTYTYDEENRLSSAISFQSSANYEYDAFNRRVKKTVNGVTTYYLSDFDDEIAEYDGSGNLLAEYVYGDSIDEVLTMSRGGQTYFYHHDGLGSVTDLTDVSGNLIESYDYDVYGMPSRTSSVGNPFFFTGRRLDSETGLYDLRARMYSPRIGRFMQRDPIGYYDSMNLFSYAFNSPTNYVDPFGLEGTFGENF